MTAVLDTNVLIRHIRGEPKFQARRATAFLESADEDLLLTSLVMAEVVFVLESNYGQPRDAVVVAALSLLAMPAIVAPESDVIVEALRWYQSARVHFVDAYVAAVANRTADRRLVSFD